MSLFYFHSRESPHPSTFGISRRLQTKYQNLSQGEQTICTKLKQINYFASCDPHQLGLRLSRLGCHLHLWRPRWNLGGPAAGDTGFQLSGIWAVIYISGAPNEAVGVQRSEIRVVICGAAQVESWGPAVWDRGRPWNHSGPRGAQRRNRDELLGALPTICGLIWASNSVVSA